jgi:hypothetical protein
MPNKAKYVFLLSLCIALCLVFVSCDASKQGEIQEITSQTTTSTSEMKITENVSTTLPEFTGNKDFWWNVWYGQVPYKNGEGGITFEVLSNPFRLGDSYENLGVRVISIDPELYIANYAPYLNLEKKINGEWVRLEVNYGPHFNGSEDEVARNRRYEFLETYHTYHMLECQIIPELSVGEYRFIVYIITEQPFTHVRQYYIPFEVVE